VDFSTSDCIIGKPDPGNAFHFPPAGAAVNLEQASPFANVNTDGDGSLLGDFPDELELHSWLLPEGARRSTRAGPEAVAEFRLGPARLMRAYGRLPAKSPDACATSVTRAAQNALVIK